MTDTMTLILAALAAVAGIAAGWLHFRALRPIADRIVAGGWSVVLFQPLRLAVLGGFLLICARGGTPVLLAAAAGILGGRWIVLRSAEKEAM